MTLFAVKMKLRQKSNSIRLLYTSSVDADRYAWKTCFSQCSVCLWHYFTNTP